MKRRYFISFLNKHEGNQRTSHRVLIWNGDFMIDEAVKFLEKENNCSEVVILYFKELEDYEQP